VEQEVAPGLYDHIDVSNSKAIQGGDSREPTPGGNTDDVED
jgi:hypothetical protein